MRDQLTSVKRPGVTPSEETWSQIQSIEASGHIGDDPEDEEERTPRETDDHSHVLTWEAEGTHSHPIQHPVDNKGPMAVGIGVVGGLSVGCGGIVKRDLEGQ